MTRIFLLKFTLIAFFIPVILFITQGCEKYTDPSYVAYRNLTKTGNWRIESLRIIRTPDSFDTVTAPLDTVLYNYGTLQFKKYKVDEFDGTIKYASGGEKNFTAKSYEFNGSLFLDMIYNYNGSGASFPQGSGYLSDKKGNDLRISGVEGGVFWSPGTYSGGYYSPAPFLTQPGYYRCEWHIVAE